MSRLGRGISDSFGAKARDSILGTSLADLRGAPENHAILTNLTLLQKVGLSLNLQGMKCCHQAENHALLLL
jgi:hypothetical protein